MGDRRFLAALDAILFAPDRARAIYDLPDEGVIHALAALSMGDSPGARGDPFLANVLATEALNRIERARVIAKQLGEGVFAVDPAGCITFANPAALGMVGYANAELVGHPLHALVEPTDVEGRPIPPGETASGRALRGPATASAPPGAAFTRKDGTRFPVAYTAAPLLRDGVLTGAVIVFRDRTAEQHAAAELRAEVERGRMERDRLQAVLSALPVAVAIIDPGGRIVARNDAAKALWIRADGAEAAPGSLGQHKGWWAATGAPIAPHEWPAARAVREGVPMLDDEVVLEVAGDERKTFLQSAVPIHGAGGAVEGAVVVSVDITERKRVEDALTRQKGLYETLIQAQSDLGEGVVLSTAGRVVYVNEAIVAMTGYTREEILALPSFLLFVDPADRDEMQRRIQRRMAGEPSPDRYAIGIIRRDGRRIDVELSVKTVHGSQPGAPLIVALVRDVTEERRRAWEAREAEERYRLLVHSVQEYAILMLDRDGRVMNWNPGAQRILGYSAEEALGKPFSMFHTPEDVAAGVPQGMLERARDLGRIEEEGWRVRRDGTRFRASVALAILRGPDDAVHGFAMVTRDRTSQLAQAALARRAAEQASRTRELETFSYTVAHDLRAPLRGMIHLTEFLERDQAERLDEEGRQNLRALRTSAERMGRLVDDLLSLSRSSNVEMRRTEVDISALARAILEIYRERDPGRQVDTRVEEGLRANADPNLTRILLDNLIGNAWKFTRRTPRPRIEIGAASVDKRAAGAEQGATPLAPPPTAQRAFFVRDNGVGFDPAKAHELFTPFRRLHPAHEYEGTGIGLATVHRIVLRHGGMVWAEAEPGKGATVWFTLPDA